jgi:hypothetical protein
VAEPPDPIRSPTAVIWIPGLGTQDVNENLVEIAKRIAFASNRSDKREATFAVRTALKTDKLGDGTVVPRATVLRTDRAGTRSVLDIYGLGTTRSLIGSGRLPPSGVSFSTPGSGSG